MEIDYLIKKKRAVFKMMIVVEMFNFSADNNEANSNEIWRSNLLANALDVAMLL